jgi:hypothetical protein
MQSIKEWERLTQESLSRSQGRRAARQHRSAWMTLVLLILVLLAFVGIHAIWPGAW